MHASEEVAAQQILTTAPLARIYHKGPPDFLVIEDGQPPRFAEVKTSSDTELTPDQKVWKTALESVGLRYDVIIVPAAPSDDVTIGVRVTERVRAELHERAIGNHRSLSDELRKILEDALEGGSA